MTSQEPFTPAAAAEPTPAGRTIESWEQLDQAMGELRRLDARIAGVDARYDRLIQGVQERKAKAARPLSEARKQLFDACLTFVRDHEGEIDAKKKKSEEEAGRSRKLVNGEVGTRFGAVKVKLEESEAKVIATLKALGHLECFKVAEELVLGKCKDLPAAVRTRAGIALVREKSWFVTLAKSPVVTYPDPPKAADDAAKAGA